MCAALAADAMCEQQSEICTSSDPVTRIVNGVAVTQPCWAWQRTYQCNRITSGHNDCGALEANRACTYVRTECLDEEPDGACKVEERVYRCPTPGSAVSDAPQYICGNDVYCINGDCEPIVREASTEFKEALVALHSIDQAGKEFDETNFTVFQGKRETCHKPVFGLINCCAGKVSGLLTVAAGGAALVGGPFQIAALATPFLTLGQWFYCAKPKAAEANRAVPAAPLANPVERMAAITRQLDELKARAILEPTEANVIAYIRFQREQLDRASTFSDTWQRALWQNPDLDYTLQRPVSTVGKRAWLDNRKADRDAVMASLSQRYGLFYFFAQSCGACELFAPILRSVSDSHGMAVMAVSMDGGPSREFPNYVVDAGQRERMGVPGKETPALVLFDTATRRTIPVGFGILSADEIMDRIFALTNTKVGSDY
ncbi:hypothetical protein M527_04825 [Sphingobium indicum IP26]|nr:hypothetical protein M527_02940 [Sphingobium indicum IP26]EPR11412.1 hypothetical protein M527_04825 [Sphingobium indicum IP26]